MCVPLCARSMAAHGSEAVMLRAIPARRGGGAGGSTIRSILELRIRIRGGMRIALAVGLLACVGWQGLWASTPALPPGLTVHRSTRVFPHRFTVRPNGATITANQSQRFEVTDANGKSVAVHWNVSGIDCSGLACGTIDDHGVYRTPASLPQPRVVILEGVLVSDPNYSVLTQIELVAAVKTSVSPASAQVSSADTKQMPGLAVGRQNLARNAVLPPPPNAVAAAPVVGRQIVARASFPPPLSNVTAPPPVIEGKNVAPGHSLPPLPNAVAAAPVVERQTIARASQPPPQSNVTAPPAVMERNNVAPRHSLPPQSIAIDVAPVVERQTIARGSQPPPQSNVTAPLPVIEGKNVAPRLLFSPLPNAIAAAPVVERQIVARNSPVPPLPVANAAWPASGQIATAKTQQLAAPVVGQSVARRD